MASLSLPDPYCFFFSPLYPYKSHAPSPSHYFCTCSHSALAHTASPFGAPPPGHCRPLKACRR
jgi:hypothetical protein